MKEYDLVGADYRKVRSPDIGVSEVLSHVKSFGRKISILDLGCGNGFPIASGLFEYSHRYLGVDSSSVISKEFEENLPNAQTYLCSMDKMDLNDEVFDLVFTFGSIFHLPPETQTTALEKAAKVVAPGGILLFTAWKEQGLCYRSSK